ncbi:MAG: hypothetical protein IKY23_00840 [Lachnospiraceae bacterium]|nr:hypothetical protein [Lachnospiraceae bacterium]
MKKILFILFQCTWGIIPTIAGAIFFLKLRKYPHTTYRGCIDTRWDMRSGLSLGLFIFTPNDEINDSAKIRVHEYGHCIQSIVLGPLFVIFGIISLVWGRHPYFEKKRREEGLRYTSCFVEAWASKWGELVTGEEAIWD